MPVVPSLPRPGDRLAGFRIERELGHGTTGVVYLARQEALGRNVALKVVGRPLATDAAFRERFRQEARTVAGLDHPNVVQVLESGEDEAHLWLAMRLVDGPDLRVLLRRTGRLEPEQAVAIVEQVASALDAAHAAGLVHRDVKPGNLLIEDGRGRDLHVELADFGLARTPGVDEAEGTPGYAAPEQLAGTEAGPAADVFALGCVLFELLTGVAPPAIAPRSPEDAPWRSADREAAARTYAASFPLVPSVALPRVGGAFDPTLERATALDPAERFGSAGELAIWARAALTVPRAGPGPDPAEPVRAAAAVPVRPAEIGPAAPTWEVAPAPPRRRRGRRALVGAFLALVLALLGTAFVFIGTLGDSSRDPRPGDTTASAPTPPGGAGAGSGAAGSGSRSGPGAGPGAEAATGRGGQGSSGSSGPATGGSSSARGGGAGAARTGPGAAGADDGDRASRDSGTSGGGRGDGAEPSGGPAGAAVPRAGRRAPTGAGTVALPPVPAGFVRFGGGGWVLDLPAAAGWRQTGTQELDGGTRLVTRLLRPDAVRLVVESLPGRTAVVGVPTGRPFPVRLPDAGRTDGVLYRGGRYAMCATGVCAAVPANGPNGGVLLIASARQAVGVERVARRAASGLRVR